MPYRRTEPPYIELAVFALIILITVLAMFRGAFVNHETVTSALKKQGYTEVKIVKHAWVAVPVRGCGTGDAARFTVEAKTPAGNTATFYVCSGWLFKSMTIRFE